MSTAYRLITVKGTREITGTQAEAVTAAIALETELQPAFGVTVEPAAGETVAEIRDGVDTYADDAEVEVELASPVGPRVLYADGTDAEQVDAEIPAGWTVDYTSQVRTDSGRWSCPLVRA